MTQLLDASKPALGLGCWAIGGPFFAPDGRAVGWGEVDDATSIRAIQAGVDRGIRFFDTAQAYGTGHSETILGQALHDRPEVKIATKIGLAIDPATKHITGEMTDTAAIRDSITASAKRLRRDRIDLILLHLNELEIAQAAPIFDLLAEMHRTGQIGTYGWSTDFPDRAAAFADHPGFVAIEHAMNVFFRADRLVPTIEGAGLTGLVRSPLAMGILSGKYDEGTHFSTDDVRGTDDDWKAYFSEGRIKSAFLAQLRAVREILTSGGRTLPQGAIAWLWGRSAGAAPIPGFRTPEQVIDLCGAWDHGPLTEAQMKEIEVILDRPEEGPPAAR